MFWKFLKEDGLDIGLSILLFIVLAIMIVKTIQKAIYHKGLNAMIYVGQLSSVQVSPKDVRVSTDKMQISIETLPRKFSKGDSVWIKIYNNGKNRYDWYTKLKNDPKEYLIYRGNGVKNNE